MQGNMPQYTKWDPDAVGQRIEQYSRLTRMHWDNDLIIWPENSMTAYFHQLDESFLQPFKQEAIANNSELIIGIPFLNQETYQYYSSFMTIGAQQTFYHKTHLVPFGEYLPLDFLLRDLINFFSMPMSDFSRGDWIQPLLQVKGQKVAATICYEDAFGEELIRYLPEASLLVNGSNNAWYGNSFAPHQHLQISRMRAVETGRDLMRATTNGISALVNHKGKIQVRSRQFESDVVTGIVQPRSGATPYVNWGNYPVLAGLLLCLLFVIVRNRSQQND
ncbi:MAG: apolipoprotein N-acyltransferase [Gammaproteobacteria bacterium]